MQKTLATVALLGLAASGCSGGDIDGTLGQLGEGVFRYSCIEDGDARCNETNAVSSIEVSTSLGVDTEVPEAIAVGARFDLTYLGDTTTNNELLVVDVEPARTDLVTHASGFVIEVPGQFAFLARNGAKRRVVDFIHLDAVAADHVAVWHAQQRVESIELTAMQEQEVAVMPFSEDDIPLAGAFATEWTTSDDTVVAIAGLSSSSTPSDKLLNADEVRLVAVSEGTATLTVAQGDLSAEVAITVGPEVMP
jgi:hypothetical protein